MHTCMHTYIHIYIHAYILTHAYKQTNDKATCHAPHREAVYSEIKRVLKPGALFACYEWCLTDKHQKGN